MIPRSPLSPLPGTAGRGGGLRGRQGCSALGGRLGRGAPTYNLYRQCLVKNMVMSVVEFKYVYIYIYIHICMCIYIYM